MQHNKVKEFLGEKYGKQLRVEIYSDSEGYFANFYVNDTQQTTRTFYGNSLDVVESSAKEWLSSIDTLYG